MKINDLIYYNIKALAKKGNIAIGELEKKNGLSVGYLSRMHNKGRMLDMSLMTIINIAECLGTSLEGLMTVDYAAIERIKSIQGEIHEHERAIERLQEELDGCSKV